jgi:hypothetical protein
MSSSRRSNTSTPKQPQANATNSSPTLKSTSALSQTTSRSQKSRSSMKSPSSKRSPSPRSRIKQQSLNKTDETSDTKSSPGVDETEQSTNPVDTLDTDKINPLTSESIVEEPVEQGNPLVIFLFHLYIIESNLNSNLIGSLNPLAQVYQKLS